MKCGHRRNYFEQSFLCFWTSQTSYNGRTKLFLFWTTLLIGFGSICQTVMLNAPLEKHMSLANYPIQMMNLSNRATVALKIRTVSCPKLLNCTPDHKERPKQKSLAIQPQPEIGWPQPSQLVYFCRVKKFINWILGFVKAKNLCWDKIWTKTLQDGHLKDN